jgi:Gram-negative bacterial TonB protein C-terminal
LIVADVPLPSASPAAACARPNTPARVVRLVRPVGAEKYLEGKHTSGITDVKVYLGADGAVVKAVIARSSGDAFLDGATYDAALATKYAPEVRDCREVAGAYIYRTRYNGVPLETPAASPAPAPAAT